MTPEALRRRMAHGNIYTAEKVDAALAHYFRPGNLAALRELALLWVADRVDEGLEEYRERHGITEPWETRERVVVALTGAPGGEHLIRRGARMAARSHGELVGVHVRHVRRARRARRQDLLDRHRALLEELGGRYAEVDGRRPRGRARPVRRARRTRRSSCSVRRQRSRWAELTQGIGDQPRHPSSPGRIDVHVISTGLDGASRTRGVQARREPAARAGARPREGHRLGARSGRHAAVRRRSPAAPATRSACPACCFCSSSLRSRSRCSGDCGPRSWRSASRSSRADWFYIEPTHSLRFAHAGDALALVVFVAVSALVSGLVDRLAGGPRSSRRVRPRPRRLAELASGTAPPRRRRPPPAGRSSFASRSPSTSVAVLAPTPEGGGSRRRQASLSRRRRRARPTPPSSQAGACSW